MRITLSAAWRERRAAPKAIEFIVERLTLLQIGENFVNPALITRVQRIRHRNDPPRFRIWTADANPQDVTTAYGEESAIFEAFLQAHCLVVDAAEEATKPTKEPKGK